MAILDRIFRADQVVTSEGARRASIHVASGKIVRLADYDDVEPGVPLVDAGTAAILPGFCDSHVHVNEPGRTSWEGFESATRAAASGGVTTLVDMPLNSIPPTTTVANLRAKAETITGQAWVDVGLWGGAIPGNSKDLLPLIEAGALGFKCFMVDSGVDEFPHVDERALREAMAILAETRAPLLVHAEVAGPIDAAAAKIATMDTRSYARYLASRPREAEDLAIALLLRNAREHRARLHVVHLSSSTSIAQLKRARAEGIPITSETTPHYLALTAEEIPDGATPYKCAPPIREAENRERLWEGVFEGDIDLIVSDHSPCTPELKRLDAGDFEAAWGGIASLQIGPAVIWTEAKKRGRTLVDLARWMSRAPAELAGLSKTKGAIAVGNDADFCFFEPNSTYRVEAARLAHKNKLTPYEGRELSGVVARTYLRGELVYDASAPADSWRKAPRGAWIRP